MLLTSAGVGYNNIDVETATKPGIPDTNTPGVLSETTADMAWALLMAAARRIPEAHNRVAAGKWEPSMGLDIGPGGFNRKKVLGIMGFGRIGQAVMRWSRGFKRKPTAILINSSRGPVVDEKALVTALKEGKIAAGLDFFEKEPLLSPGIAKLNEVFASPKYLEKVKPL